MLCLTYLIIVVGTMKERLFLEDHRRKHASEAPHIKGVVVILKQVMVRHNAKKTCQIIHKQFGSFKVPRRHAHIVFRFCVVEFGEAPIN